MKNTLLMKVLSFLLMALFPMYLAAQDSSVHSVRGRTTLYPAFSPATIYLSDGRVVKERNANIFLKNATLVYKSGGVVKKVKPSLISKVQFADATYYRVDTLLASVVDSVQGSALYKASVIDIETYNELVTASSSVTDVIVAEYVSVGTVERTAAEDKDYPLIDYYFMDFQDRQVLMEDRKLYRIVPKNKRRLYKDIISAPDFSWASPESLCKLMDLILSSSAGD
ncbi:MAG: hypothetical protein ACI4BA_06035 [Prevotella sp.]